MRIRDHLLLAAHRLASAIDGLTDWRHLTTDPACVHHVPVTPGSRLDRVSRGESCSPCLARRAFGYDLDEPDTDDDNGYARTTSDRLFRRGLDITRSEIREGLALAGAIGIEGADAETSLHAFLLRLVPTDPASTTPRRFIGWDTLGLALDTMLDGLPAKARNEVLARKWGNDSIRIAHAVWLHGKARTHA
ncbi:hypothetical protein ACF1AJ_20525 [Leifsonia sp. NPDC014704]|uniref:hypothetical protein n=1 Tax=Leifsonia sp. NPDC014704 TaxID=3364123 RepID=UPI0036F4763C